MQKPKSIYFFALMASALLTTTFARAEDAAFSAAVNSGALTEGQYVTEKQAVNAGEGWLALQKTDRGWELVPTMVKTLVVPSAGGGLLVDVSSPLPRVQAMLKNSKLKAGPVDTIKLADGSLQPTFAKGAGGYADVTVSQRPEHQGFKVSPLTSDGPLIVFTSGAGEKLKSTVIGKAPFTPTSNYTAVFWMGDLDRDGKIDLITSESEQPSTLRVWLSSEAKGKEALAQVN